MFHNVWGPLLHMPLLKRVGGIKAISQNWGKFPSSEVSKISSLMENKIPSSNTNYLKKIK